MLDPFNLSTDTWFDPAPAGPTRARWHTTTATLWIWIDFSRAVLPRGPLVVSRWTLVRFANVRYTVAAAYAFWYMVRLRVTVRGASIGPDTITYAGSDGLLRDLHRLSVPAFTLSPWS
jgi:hypothetical protein